MRCSTSLRDDPARREPRPRRTAGGHLLDARRTVLRPKALERTPRGLICLAPCCASRPNSTPSCSIAYRYGAIFLAEKAPAGAGQPEAALQLLRRGHRRQPGLLATVAGPGIHLLLGSEGLRQRGARLPGRQREAGRQALGKSLAASVAAQGGAAQTSRLLWSEIYRQADNDQIRVSAENHLRALQAQEEIESLNALLTEYRQGVGRPAHSFRELVAAGLLRARPRDPTGAPYQVGSGGLTTLAPGSKIDLRLVQ